MSKREEKDIDGLELELEQVTRTKSILNRNQVQKLWNSTKKRYKYDRPAKGGGTWTYVKASYVRKVLDSVFGFDWSFEIETSLSEAFEVAQKTGACVVKGKLTCKVIDDRGVIREIVKQQFGRSEVKWVKGRSPDDVMNKENVLPKPLDFGNDMKAATSDCLKKCASLIGVASDVYEADEFIEIIITDSDEDKAKGARRQTKRQKDKLLRQEAESVGGQNESNS